MPDLFEMVLEHVYAQKRTTNLRSRSSIEADLRDALTKLLEPEPLEAWAARTMYPIAPAQPHVAFLSRALTTLLDERNEA